MLIIKNWAATCAVFLLFAGLFTGCTPKGPKSLIEGRELIEAGEFTNAIEELQIATSLMETNADAWNYLGIAYHHTGQSTNAEAAYMKALSLDRNLAESYFNLGCLRFDEGRMDAAKSALISYTALRGNSIEGWLKLASVHLRLREFAAAEKSLQEALRLNARNPEALNGIGVVYLQRRDPRQAAVYFNNALDAQPDYAPALLNLAIVNHVNLNNPSLALRKYREYLALPVRPTNWEAVNLTAEALDQQLHPESDAPAIQSAAGETGAAPGSRVAGISKPANSAAVPASSPRADTTARTSQVTRAAAETPVTSRAATNATRTVASAPVRTETQVATNRPGILRQMNPLRLLRGDSNTSAPSSAATPSSSPVASEASRVESAAAAAFPRYKYRKPSKPSSGNSAAAQKVFVEGSRAHQAHRYSEAIDAYQRATQLDPAFYEAYYNMALASLGSGSLSQALTAYEFALAIRPDSLDARYNFAVALRQANYVADAAKEFENVLAKHPQEARAHVALGNIYAQQLRQPAKAKEHYTKALELNPRNPQASAIRYWLSSH